MAGCHLPWSCILHFLTIGLGMSCCSAAATCTATTNCIVNCKSQGLGPEAPNLSEIIPSSCHGQVILELILEDNVIDHIPVNWLSGWKIRILNLGYNRLSNIEDGAFRGTDCFLERLFLHGSSRLVDRKRLTKATFQGLGCSLTRLSLDGTGLENDDLYAFDDLVHLDQLHMVRNRLTRIPEGALSHLIRLRLLFLFDNALVIPYYEQPFLGLDSLTGVDLQNNLLETVSYCSFGQLLRLKDLNLENNPRLKCNCTVWWLAQAGYGWPESLLGCEVALRGKCEGYVVPDCQPLLPHKTYDPVSDVATATTIVATLASSSTSTATVTTTAAAAANNGSVKAEKAGMISAISVAALLAVGIIAFIIWKCRRKADRFCATCVRLRSGIIRTVRRHSGVRNSSGATDGPTALAVISRPSSTRYSFAV